MFRLINIAAFLLVCCCISASGQNDISETLIDKNWGLEVAFNRRQIMDSIPTDTLVMVKMGDEDPETFYLGGFRFCSNGEFKQLLQPCREGGAKPENNTWSLESEIIIVKIEDLFIWYFRILEIEKNRIVALHWVEKL